MTNDERYGLMITGAEGMLGKYLVSRFSERDEFNVIPSTRETMDLADRGSVERFFSSHHIDYIINCAGVKPENGELLTLFRSNSLGAKILAEAVEKTPSVRKLVHISTDAVFSEHSKSSSGDIDEFPPSEYGLSKLLGERYILGEVSDKRRVLICRPSWLYGPGTESTFIHKFLKAYFKAVESGATPKLVVDSLGKPISCEFLFLFLEKVLADPLCHGICDASHKMGLISRCDFGLEIARIWNTLHPERPIDASRIERCSLDDFKMRYASPKMIYETVNVNTEHIYSLRDEIPHCESWQHYLEQFMRQNLA